MSWKCPRCNTVHPYSVRKCPCGDASSSHKKASPPTRKCQSCNKDLYHPKELSAGYCEQCEKIRNKPTENSKVTGEDQKTETVALELAHEDQETTKSRKQTENLEARTESKELRSDLNTLGQKDETSKQAHEHFEGITENDAKDVSLHKPEDYGEIGVVDMNYSKEETMGVSMQNITSSPFERFVFMITRVLAFCGAVAILAGIAVLTTALLSAKSTTVTYEELAKELPSSDSGQSPPTSVKASAPSVRVAIPANLQPHFQGKNSDILSGWLEPLSASEQHSFLKNLSVIVEQVKKKANSGDELVYIVNRYHALKIERLKPSEIDKYAALATKSGYIAGIFGLLLILSILSLVLVMLAIERNTRLDRAFSNRQNL